MTDHEADFRNLIAQVRLGDEAAAAALVGRYEPEIRRTIRMRLTDARLRRVLDSMDICQSVMGNFFVRVSAGEFELESSSDLIHLLVSMVRNKVVDQARRLQAAKRDQRRIAADGDSVLQNVEGNNDNPQRVVANRDLLNSVRQRLTEHERYLADSRASGRQWSELAEELGVAADTLRKQLSRALDRVSAELQIEDLWS